MELFLFSLYSLNFFKNLCTNFSTFSIILSNFLKDFKQLTNYQNIQDNNKAF